MKYLSLVLITLMISSCSLFQSKPQDTTSKPLDTSPTNWVIKGKIGWQNPKDNGSASIHWLQKEADFTLKLFGPLGQGGGTIEGNDTQLAITPKGEPTTYSEEPDQLMMDSFGFFVPVENLRYWVRGLANPKQVATSIKYNDKDPESLQQNGWQIQYDRIKSVSGWRLPHKLTLTHSDVTVKLIIHEWQLSED